MDHKVLANLHQLERDVKWSNKDNNKRNVYGIDSGKIILNLINNGLSYQMITSINCST